MKLLDALDAEVKSRADQATSELLPRLLENFLQDDRLGLLSCERHSTYLSVYVEAQIRLTKQKQRLTYADYITSVSDTEYLSVVKLVERAKEARDKVRSVYRSTPCTCWVQHR